MPFLIFWRDHLRSSSGIICGPIWGSFPVWGSFAVGDHLRRCTATTFCEKTLPGNNLRANPYKNQTNQISSARLENSISLLFCIKLTPSKNTNKLCFFPEIVLSFREKQPFRFTLQTRFSESQLG